MRSRRALLYMPASDWHKIEKATTLDVDSICMDLEDGVALNSKAEARANVVRALTTLNFGRTERLVRINAIGSGLEGDDLTAVVPARPDGIVLPKIGCAEQLDDLSRKIAAMERARGWEVGSIRLFPLIETARGVVNLPAIAGADPRIEALLFGGEDLAADIGATRTPEADELLYARTALVTCAAAFGLQAIDMVCIDLVDPGILRQEARQGMRLGYRGKQVIHPRQIPTVLEAFAPDKQEVQLAQRIVDANAAQQAAGSAVFALDGKMIDGPIVKAAERVLARASAQS